MVGAKIMPVSLTRQQASDLIAELREVLAGHGQFLDIVMPNGKKMRDCSSRYVSEVSVALHRIASEDVIKPTTTSRRTAA
jgi:hypothetical protein